MTGDPLDRIEGWAHDTLAVATIPHARDVLALVEVARAARAVIAGTERDQPEWLDDSDDSLDDEFRYFLRLKAALARLAREGRDS